MPSVHRARSRAVIAPTVKGMVAERVSPPAEVMTVVNEPAPVVLEPVAVKVQPLPAELRVTEARVEERLVASPQLLMA